MIIIAGLGNPGASYQYTRHNVGFMLIDRLSAAYGIKCKKKGFDSIYGVGVINSSEVVLAKPQCFMNLSGNALGSLAAHFDVANDKILIVCDDCELPPGRIRIRKSGGAGTHNGLKSVISVLSSKDFPRMRLGVGSAPPYMDLSDYVLSNFSREEIKAGGVVDVMLDRGVEAVETILSKDIVCAMNEFNPL